jgi:hypothetical protein
MTVEKVVLFVRDVLCPMPPRQVEVVGYMTVS